MKNFKIILASLFASLSIGSFVTAARSQYGFIGIYNISPFTLSDGEGSAVSLDINGNLKISPSSVLSELEITNLKYGGDFCEIYSTDNVTSTFDVGEGLNYVKISPFDYVGSTSTYCQSSSTAGNLIINKTGHYRVSGSFSFENLTNNVITRMAVFLNDVEQNEIHLKRKIATGGDVGNAGFTGIINVTTTPSFLDTRIRHDTAATTTFVFEYMNLNIEYIGE